MMRRKMRPALVGAGALVLLAAGWWVLPRDGFCLPLVPVLLVLGWWFGQRHTEKIAQIHAEFALLAAEQETTIGRQTPSMHGSTGKKIVLWTRFHQSFSYTLSKNEGASR